MSTSSDPGQAPARPVTWPVLGRARNPGAPSRRGTSHPIERSWRPRRRCRGGRRCPSWPSRTRRRRRGSRPTIGPCRRQRPVDDPQGLGCLARTCLSDQLRGDVDANNVCPQASKTPRCAAVPASHVQHPCTPHGRRQKTSDTFGDEPLSVAYPAWIPVGDRVVTGIPRHNLLPSTAPGRLRSSAHAGQVRCMSVRRGHRGGTVVVRQVPPGGRPEMLPSTHGDRGPRRTWTRRRSSGGARPRHDVK